MIHLNVTGEFAFNEDLHNYLELTIRIVGTTINILTFFIIYKYSTADMKDYRVQLMLYQYASASLDFLLGTLASPILFLPMLCGTGQGGLLSGYFGVGPFALYIIVFTYMATDVHFIALGPIFYRWQQVLPTSSWMKARGPISRILYEYGYLVFATVPTPFLYLAAGDDIEIVKQEFRQKYPNNAHLADIESWYYFNVDKHPTFIYGILFQASWMTYAIVMIAFCNVSMIRTLNDLRVHMSAATRRMHFRFLRMIAMQTAVPLIWVVLPLAYLLTILFKEIRFPGIQNVNNLALSLGGTHGLVVSIYLLSTVPAYRHAIYSIFILPIRNLLGFPEAVPISAMQSTVAPNSLAVVS